MAGRPRVAVDRRRHPDLVHVGERLVHGGVVLLDDLGALPGVGLLDRLLDLGDGLVGRQHAGDGEEAGLHDGVDAPAHAGLPGHVHRVDHVELQLLLDQVLLDLARQVVPDLVPAEGRVEQEDAARHRVAGHVVALEERELVAGHEVRPPDQVGASGSSSARSAGARW